MAGTAVRVDCIQDSDALEALGPAWEVLWDHDSHATPFQARGWLAPWLRHFSSGTLLVLAFWTGSDLVGLAPLVRESVAADRVVRLAGQGISDYLDVLAAPDHRAEVGAGVLTFLALNREAWNRCEFENLPPSSPLLVRRAGAARHDLVDTSDACPVLRRGADEEWPIPPAFRHRLEYDARRLARDGRFHFQTATPKNRRALLDALFVLHRARWETKAQAGVLAEATLRHFHEEVSERLMASGQLRLYALYEYERPIACWYGFLHRDRAYYYLSGFDPRFDRLGVGHQIVWHALQQAKHDGATTFDFLRGQESYKYRWGAQDVFTVRRVLARELAAS